MARLVWSLRANTPARAVSALIRSALAVLSLSIGAVHSAAISSSSPAEIVLKQRAVSTGGTVSASCKRCGAAAERRTATAVAIVKIFPRSGVAMFHHRPRAIRGNNGGRLAGHHTCRN